MPPRHGPSFPFPRAAAFLPMGSSPPHTLITETLFLLKQTKKPKKLQIVKLLQPAEGAGGACREGCAGKQISNRHLTKAQEI